MSQASVKLPDDHPLARVRRRLLELGRGDVRIIAVSKTHGPDRIAELHGLGQRDFGENRQNEARDKFPLVACDPAQPPPIYHHIGPLQSSGARQIPGLFTWVHGAGSVSAMESLAKAALRFAEREGPPGDPDLWPLRYLVQLNLTEETSKAGGMTEDLLRNMNQFPENEALTFRGFMTMGPTSRDPAETREVFHRLREIRDELLPGGELSMGMSGDWETAVGEGATMIRLGTSIFGPRGGAAWRPQPA